MSTIVTTETAILGWNVRNTYVNMTGVVPRWNIPDYFHQYPDEYYNYDYYQNKSYIDYWYDSNIGTKNTIGSIYAITSAIQLILYVRILMIIIFDKDLYKLPAYKLIVHLGYADIIAIISNFTSGLFMIFVIDQVNPWGFWCAKTTGFMYLFGGFGNLIFTMILAYNRFVQMIFEEFVHELFGPTRTKIIILSCWLLSFVYPIVYMTPITTLEYNPWLGAWVGNGKYNMSTFISQYFYFSYQYWFYSPILTMIVYAIIILYLIYLKFRFHHVSSHWVEIRLTIQMTIIGSLAIFDLAYSFYWENAVKQKIGYMYSNFISFFIWYLYNGINPIIYLFFNNSIRRQFLPVIWKKKQAIVHVLQQHES